MAKRRREQDSDCTATETPEFITVFVDTSLDTHLAMLVRSSDTVSDFKKKLALEHKQCFPATGEILINSVKVKRRSNFYHLPDIMLVWGAFHGVKRHRFLSADVSEARTSLLIKSSCEFDTNNGVKMGVTNLDDNSRVLSSDENRTQTLPIPFPDGAAEKNVVSETMAGEKSVEKITGFQSNICSEENSRGTDSRPKKKRKVMTVDVCHNPRYEDDRNLFQASCKDASIPEILSNANVMVDAVRESPRGGILLQENGVNDRFDEGVVFEGISPPTTTEKSNLGSIMTSQNHLASDERKKESKMDHELAQDAPTNHLESVLDKVPDHSARLMDAGCGVGEVDTDRSKRKKRKAGKTVRNGHDTTDKEQSGKGESIKRYSETHESDEKEKEKGLSLEHGHDVIMPSNSKVSDHVSPESPLKDEKSSQDAHAVVEPEISSDSKKKRKKRKSRKGENTPVNTNSEQSGVEQTENGTSGSLPPSTDHIPQDNGNEEGVTNHGKEEDIANPVGKDVQVLLSASDATEKVQGVIRNVGDSVILTHTQQNLEDVGSGDKITDNKSQRSDGNCHSNVPALEIEYPIFEFKQVENSNENTINKDGKTPKKRKKRTLTASQVQEDFPVENQIGNEALATKGTSNIVNSEQEDRIVNSSQVLSKKTEEKLKVTCSIAEDTCDLAKTSEQEGGRIDFKQYFVPCEFQNKLDSGDKVKKGTKSIHEMETSKTVKDNVIPSASNSNELQSAVKSLENKRAEKKSRKRGSSRSMGESTQNSSCNEMISKSFRRSSGASENRAKHSEPSEICGTPLRKPNETLAASSRVNKKNRTSLEKPSSGGSEIFPGKEGQKWMQAVMNVTMPFKTPQKKSLFTKSGAIFEDNSGESSGDENGTRHSTHNPSDSSSLSGHSADDSDLSQGSTKNRSSDAEGRSTGQRNMSKLDSSANDDITMDMILRSSKRFKEAKLLASQNEDESHPVDFVPDSPPS